ncbi:Hypothetical protein ABZS17G119_00075 [Kosakonia cowanii]
MIKKSKIKGTLELRCLMIIDVNLVLPYHQDNQLNLLF